MFRALSNVGLGRCAVAAPQQTQSAMSSSQDASPIGSPSTGSLVVWLGLPSEASGQHENQNDNKHHA